MSKKKIDLNKVEDLKEFINYEMEDMVLEVTDIAEIKNDGIRLTVENLEDNKIQFIKVYLSKQGLPFYKKLVQDAGWDLTKASNPMYLLGEKLRATTYFINEEQKITKLTNIKPF